MIKKISKFVYILLIFIILYFPLIQFLKYINIKHLFKNKELIISVSSLVMICAIISFIIGIISIFICRYLYIKKKDIYKPICLPLMIGLIIYLLKTFIGINSYLLLVLGYLLLLTPLISYLEFKYLKSFIVSNKAVLKDFNKIEYLRVMDKSIMTYYFLCFIFIYGDNIISSMLFDNRINLLSIFIKESISANNMELIANSLYLSFGIVLLLLLIIYMIIYEVRLRGKYEKDN